jgi:Na+/proline symporter
LLVQRLLGCKSKWDAQRALMLDATFILIQFAFFLVLGVCLYAFYGGVTFQALGLTTSDEVFPKFIVENLPTGVAGLVVAGVLASAMGTLSSSISSLASSTYLDLFKMTERGQAITGRADLLWSKGFTLLWGVVLIGGAMLFTSSKNPVVELGLKIASFTYGGLLGTFFLGMLFPKVRQRDAYAGFIAGILAMVAVLTYTTIDFTWHTLIGCAVTLAVGNLSLMVTGGNTARG